MARGRMIANTVATDKRFNSLSSEAALVYLMAIPHLDRDGLILGDTMPFWGKVCPRRSEYMGHMADIIAEWIHAGLVIAYECDEGTILCFMGFVKNQTGMHYDREAASSFPPPPGFARTPKGLVKMCDELAAEQVRMNSGLNPDSVPTNSEPSPAETKVNKSNSKAKDDDGDDWDAMVKVYEHEIGLYTETIATQMGEAYTDLGATLVIDAIKEAARANIRKWSYIDGILKKWKANGRTSRGDNGDAWAQLQNNIPDYMKEA